MEKTFLYLVIIALLAIAIIVYFFIDRRRGVLKGILILVTGAMVGLMELLLEGRAPFIIKFILMVIIVFLMLYVVAPIVIKKIEKRKVNK